jgi:glycosyltransferase involved in cell wall biosynthesis
MRGQPPALVTCHGRDITTEPWGFRTSFRIDRILRDGLNNCRRVIAISRAARSLLEELGVQPERIADVPNGVELQRFQARSTFDFRGALEIPRSACVVLSVGRDHTQKAFDIGLRAFALSARTRDDVYYVLLGRGTGRWSSLARELRVESRVRFHEGLDSDRLVAAYQQSDIFMSSSRFELFSLVLLEAIATGLPILATNVSGNEDAIESGRNGLLVEPNDADLLAGGLTALLDQPDLRHRMGVENQRRAPTYDWSEIARRYLEQL